MKQIKNLVEYKKIIDLCQLENNPRTITKDKMDILVKSIENNPDYFEARPIICSDRTGKLVILAGNQRAKAAQIAGIEEVPVIVLHGLSEDKEREIIIRDNVELGEWDMDILANEYDLNALKELGVEEVMRIASDLELENFFKETDEQPKTPETITCPFCGKEFEK